MGEGALVDVAREGIYAFFRAGMPVMLVALVVGFVISLGQALTQIQEQTLVVVPKIVAVLVSLILFLPYMGDALTTYMARIAARIVAGP